MFIKIISILLQFPYNYIYFSILQRINKAPDIKNQTCSLHYIYTLKNCALNDNRPNQS